MEQKNGVAAVKSHPPHYHLHCCLHWEEERLARSGLKLEYQWDMPGPSSLEGLPL